MNKPKVYMYLSAIIITGIILRIVFYTGLYTVDDYKYANYAYETLHPYKTYQDDIQLYHKYVETGHKFFIPPWKLNFSVYLPVASAYILWGVKEWTTIIWPFLCSIGNIFLAFFLARTIFKNTSIGLISSLFIAFFPLSAIFATRLTADEISVFFTGLSCLAFLKSTNSEHRIGWGIFSGVNLAAAYMARCYMLTIGLFFFLYSLRERRGISLCMPVALTFLVIFGLENIFFLLLHYFKGFPFIFRIRAFQDIATADQRNLQMNAGHLIMQFPKMLFDFKSVGLYFYYFAVAVWFVIIKKAWRENSIPLIWFGTMFFCLWLLPMDWRSYLIAAKPPRHLSMLAFPMILIMSYALYQFSLKRRLLGYIFAGFLLISSLKSMDMRLYGPSSELIDREPFKIVAGIFKVIKPRTLYCDVPLVSYKINYYHRFKPDFSVKRSVALTPEDRDVYVLIHDWRENPSLNKEDIIRSIKAGEVLGSKTDHLKGKEFDLSRWALLKVIKGRMHFYLFYIP